MLIHTKTNFGNRMLQKELLCRIPPADVDATAGISNITNPQAFSRMVNSTMSSNNKRGWKTWKCRRLRHFATL
jgi:hypothetical protein